MSNKNGQIISEINQQEYDGWTGINASSLKKFMVSPMHYKNWLETKNQEKPSEAFRIGTAVHMAILEPHRFLTHYKISPDVDRRTKDGKANWLEFITSLNITGDNYLTIDEFNMIKSMKDATVENDLWKSYNNDSTAKVYKEAGFKCEYMGINIKGRIDFYSETTNTIIDWKTISDTPTKRVVNHEIYSKGYDVQNFIYQKGIEIVTGLKPKFLFAFIEKKPPYAIAFYELSENRINSIKEVVDYELIRMEGAKTIGIYAGLPSENNPMMLE